MEERKEVMEPKKPDEDDPSKSDADGSSEVSEVPQTSESQTPGQQSLFPGLEPVAHGDKKTFDEPEEKTETLTPEEQGEFVKLVAATFKAEGEARRLRVRNGGDDATVSSAQILQKNSHDVAYLMRRFVQFELLLGIPAGDKIWYYLNEKRSYDPAELVKVLPHGEVERISEEIVIHEPRTFAVISNQLYSGRKGENYVLRAVLKHLIDTKAAIYKKQADTYQRSPKELLDFAKIWNDVRSYPANYDLERSLDKEIEDIRREVRKYNAYRLQYPDLGLPALILRRLVSGGIIAVPEGVLEQLDQFKFDVAKLKDVKAFVVTAHQFGATINRPFWDALKHYERERNAPLVVLPIKYGPVKTVYQKETGERFLTSTFPDELQGHVLLEDFTFPGGELALNTTRMRPTLQRFLTNEICEMGGMTSQIFAAPKLELDHRPRVGRHYPKAIMTTGACHHPNYHVDNLGQQDRTGEVATKLHTFAAIVVEFDGNSFHFRQLHANRRGEFYDVNPKKGGADFFTSQGVEHRPDGVVGLVCGDWHTQKTDKDVRRGTFDKGGMVDVLKPKTVVLHDFVDGDSANPYQDREASRRGFMAPLLWDSLEKELLTAKAELDWMRENHPTTEIAVVASNHPEFITWYIESLEWRKDDINLKMGARLFVKMVEDLERRNPAKVDARATDPVVLWLREQCPTIRLLERQETLLLPPDAKDPILVSMHGDVGMRGGETRSTAAFRQMNQRVILGHNHKAVIDGPVWRVGTSTPRMQFYVKAPATDWTNTHAVIFKNGQRQLVSFVKGKWFGERQWAEDHKQEEVQE